MCTPIVGLPCLLVSRFALHYDPSCFPLLSEDATRADVDGVPSSRIQHLEHDDQDHPVHIENTRTPPYFFATSLADDLDTYERKVKSLADEVVEFERAASSLRLQHAPKIKPLTRKSPYKRKKVGHAKGPRDVHKNITKKLHDIESIIIADANIQPLHPSNSDDHLDG